MAVDGRLKLFTGVPLDREGQHTIWFRRPGLTNEGQAYRERQINFFNRYFLRQADYPVQFNRVTDGEVQVKGTFENLDDVNYIALSNVPPDSGSERWHYAFVDKVQYINQNTVKIYYTLDPLQCYQDAIQFGECFLERQHIPASDDTPGSNLVPDSIPYGDYVYQNVQADNTFPTPSYVEVPYDNPEVPDAKTAKINGWSFVVAQVDTAVHAYNYMGTPVWLHIFETFVELNDFIAKLNADGKTEEIVAMYMCPNIFLQKNEQFVGGVGEKPYISEGGFPRPDNFEGYVPANKKLFTYPYCFMTVSNNAGNYFTYKFEDGRTPDTFQYNIMGTCLPGSKPVLCPEYPGDGQKDAFGLGIQLPPLPTIPVPTDSYQIWLAQNMGSNEIANIASSRSAINSVINAIPAVGQTVAGVATDNIGLTASGVKNVANYTADAIMSVKANQARYQDAKAMPDHISGLSTPDLQYSMGYYNFTLLPTIIRKQTAIYIDNFWTRFGYPIQKIQKPNPLARDRYTYIKTADYAIISGQMPYTSNDDSGIYGMPQWCIDGWKSSLARGLTFWRYDKVIGSDGKLKMYQYGGQ